MKHIIGAATLGQSPRDDVVPGIRRTLGEGFEVLECGALDGLRSEEIARFAPRSGDYVLVTRLRDGRTVKVSRDTITPRLQQCIDRLEVGGAKIIILLCTGEFEGLSPKGRIVEPLKILYSVAATITMGKKVGILVPIPEQLEIMAKKWRTAGLNPIMGWASPYEEEEAVLEAAGKLLEQGVGAIILDCISFTEKTKTLIRRLTDVPVLVPSTLAAAVIRELF